MKKIIVIGGATASGKSAIALKIAQQEYRGNATIINADSMQIYQQLPILTAQPSEDERQNIKHKLYGFIGVDQNFSVGKWLQHVQKEIDYAFEEKKAPIIVGGTGMYLNSLINGISQVPEIKDQIRSKARMMLSEVGNEEFHKILSKHDPIMAERLNIGDSQRMVRAFEVFLQTGKSLAYWQDQPKKLLYPPEIFDKYTTDIKRDELYQKCNERFVEMVENGAVDEVRNINNIALNAEKTLGFKEIKKFLNNEITLNEAIKSAQQATRNYAKRQLTWFRGREVFKNIL